MREGTELLNDQVAGPLAPPQRQVVAILRDNSVKLQRLIEDLLDYQRALHAASGLQIGVVSLDGLLRQSRALAPAGGPGQGAAPGAGDRFRSRSAPTRRSCAP